MSLNSSHLFNILKKIPDNSNPFLSITSSDSKNNFLMDFSTDFIPKKDVRCPICLGLVIGGARPNSCYHVYCQYCLKKWAKTKKVCPYCRRKFSFILKVNLDEDFVNFQGEYFARY